jgi:hypothetical protein
MEAKSRCAPARCEDVAHGCEPNRAVRPSARKTLKKSRWLVLKRLTTCQPPLEKRRYASKPRGGE